MFIYYLLLGRGRSLASFVLTTISRPFFYGRLLLFEYY